MADIEAKFFVQLEAVFDAKDNVIGARAVAVTQKRSDHPKGQQVEISLTISSTVFLPLQLSPVAVRVEAPPAPTARANTPYAAALERAKAEA